MTTTTQHALDGTDPLAHALHYAELGWRVVPIPPGLKRPELEAWQNAATTDADIIGQWYSRWPAHGIGLATGQASGVFALDVDPGHGGDDTLASLEQANGRLPDTVEAITGGGGRHLLFSWPFTSVSQAPDQGIQVDTSVGTGASQVTYDLRNSAGRLGPGLDIRAEGGQIVVAPSIHPTSGRRYEWEASSRPGEVSVAVAPPWLIELLLEPVAELPDGQVSCAGDPRFAWDTYEAQGNAEAVRLLIAHGWHSPRTDRQGVTYLTRPGKGQGDGSGCAIGKVRPGLTYVFTSEAPPLEAERGYRLPELYAALEHGGNRASADAELCRLSRLASTYAVDNASMAAYVAGEHARAVALGYVGVEPEPLLSELITARALLAEPEEPYDWLVPDLLEKGDRWVLTGPEGKGKSTLLRQIAVQVASGRHPFEPGRSIPPATVVIVDCENSRRQIKRKLRPLVEMAGPGLEDDRLYLVPKAEGIDLGAPADLAWLNALMDEAQPDLLIIGPIYKMSNGDPTEETTAKPILMALDGIRVKHDCAMLIEAHTPHAQGGGKRPERPYGASIWVRWPEFGLFLDPAGPLRHWRGARDERHWPTALQWGKGPTSWPWEVATGSDMTYASMVEVQRQADHKLSVREIEQALKELGKPTGVKGSGISKTAIANAINANQMKWDAMLAEMEFDA